MIELQYPSVQHIMQNTGLTDHEVAKAFLETLIWLDQNAPEQFDGLKGKYSFDISEYISKDWFNHPDNAPADECGTICCIAGAASLYMSGGNYIKARNTFIDSFLSYDEKLRKLFYPPENKKAKTAARALRHYLFTGKVDWKVKVGTQYDVK